MLDGKIDVRKQYCRILGIKPDLSQDREAQVQQIIDALGENCTEVDLALLEEDFIPADTLMARWLMNDREPVKMAVSFSIPININEEHYFLGNLTADRRGAKAMALSLLGAGKTGPEILEFLLFDGFSFNQTLTTLKKLGFHCYGSFYGNIGQPNASVPLICVSKERRTKFWWQVWKWGQKDPADLTMTKIKWALLPDRIAELGLPEMLVVVTRTTPISS